jgi:hypothetical protein
MAKNGSGGLDMMGMMLRGLGIDPAALIEQAGQLGSTFQAIGAALARIEAGQARLEAQQLATMTALGIYVAPPEGETLALIEAASAAHVAQHGGLGLTIEATPVEARAA